MTAGRAAGDGGPSFRRPVGESVSQLSRSLNAKQVLGFPARQTMRANVSNRCS